MEYRLYPLKLYFRKVPVLIMVGLTLALNLFAWLWLFLQIPTQSEQVFLHYNILFGVDKIGTYGEIYQVPGLGLLILVLNLVIGWVLYRRDWFFSYSLLFAGLICNVFVVIASVLLVFLNI